MLKICCYSIPTKVFDLSSTVSYFLQDLMKKLKDISEIDLFFVTGLLVFARVGNPHYYELLGIPFVKYIRKYDERTLSSIVFAMAQANLSSEACSKSLSAALKPKLFAQASVIQGSAFIEKASVVGLIGNSNLGEFDEENLKLSLFPELNDSNKKKNLPLDIDDLYKETKHSLYKFDEFLNLTWGYLKFAVQSKVEAIDSQSWGLMVKLLNKHLAYLNSHDIRITNAQYDQIAQIKHFSEEIFKTVEKVKVPRSLADFTLHKKHQCKVYLTK